MIYPNIISTELNDPDTNDPDINDVTPYVWPEYDNYTNNTRDDDIEIDTDFFYFMMCCLFMFSFGGPIYRGLSGCCQDVKKYRQQDALQTFLTSRENEELGRTSSPDECTICLDPVDDNDVTVELQCEHKFHSACITEWLQKELTCPNCRSPLEI